MSQWFYWYSGATSFDGRQRWRGGWYPCSAEAAVQWSAVGCIVRLADAAGVI